MDVLFHIGCLWEYQFIFKLFNAKMCRTKQLNICPHKKSKQPQCVIVFNEPIKEYILKENHPNENNKDECIQPQIIYLVGHHRIQSKTMLERTIGLKIKVQEQNNDRLFTLYMRHSRLLEKLVRKQITEPPIFGCFFFL